MRLDARARAVGRKVGEQTWIVALRNLVSHAPWALGDVDIEVGPSDDLAITLVPPLLTESRAGWWRDLEAQVDAFLASSDERVDGAAPEEAEILASVVARLAWHPCKPAILRRLEERAYESAGSAETPQPAAARWPRARVGSR